VARTSDRLLRSLLLVSTVLMLLPVAVFLIAMWALRSGPALNVTGAFEAFFFMIVALVLAMVGYLIGIVSLFRIPFAVADIAGWLFRSLMVVVSLVLVSALLDLFQSGGSSRTLADVAFVGIGVLGLVSVVFSVRRRSSDSLELGSPPAER
jgi:hypothetical protein